MARTASDAAARKTALREYHWAQARFCREGGAAIQDAIEALRYHGHSLDVRRLLERVVPLLEDVEDRRRDLTS